MITLHETIEVQRPRHEVFAYLQDFSTSQEWDFATRSARKLTEGPVGAGTRFALRCELPLGHLDVDYTLTRVEHNSLLELEGHCWLFDVSDTIRLRDTDTGCQIDYLAQFNYRSPAKQLEARFRAGMEKLGSKTIAGMKAALDDNYPPPTASRKTERADRWLVPGIALFSKAGYRRGQRHWHPVSAWMGEKHVVITGASSGIGFAAALALARAGARLTLVLRNKDKAADLVERLRKESGNEAIRTELADLSLIADVNALVQRLLARQEPVDVLINNAGALFNEWAETPEGIEQSFALLALSPYQLTQGLLPLLEQARDARVINVVSGGMYTQKLQPDKLQASPDNYSGSRAYAHAKRALMVVTQQWARDWRDRGISVNAMHPGWADTPGVQSALPGFHKITRKILRQPGEGADTAVWLARASEAGQVSGLLFLDREPRPTHLLDSTREDALARTHLMEYLHRCAWELTAATTQT